jgi:hypothetical protein
VVRALDLRAVLEEMVALLLVETSTFQVEVVESSTSERRASVICRSQWG